MIPGYYLATPGSVFPAVSMPCPPSTKTMSYISPKSLGLSLFPSSLFQFFIPVFQFRVTMYCSVPFCKAQVANLFGNGVWSQAAP